MTGITVPGDSTNSSDVLKGASPEISVRRKRQRSARVAPVISVTDLARVVIVLLGRIAYPELRLREVVIGRSKNSERWIQAYNLFDGTHSRREVSQVTGIDEGDVSRAVNRWLTAGILFGVGQPEELLHLYSLGVPSKDVYLDRAD